jgi:hypothetical protein
MKITKSQLRKIIKEELLKEALPPHLQKHFRKDGSSVHKPQIKDVTPAGYGPDEGTSQVSASDIASELDMDALMDPDWGPDGVYGELSGVLGSALDDDAVAQRVLRDLKAAARQGDVPVDYLATRLAKHVNR